MTIISILLILISNAVSAPLLFINESTRDISVIFNRIAFITLILAILKGIQGLFIKNDDIGLFGGLLYTTNITETFHISILMLQLTCSSVSLYKKNIVFCSTFPGKKKSFNSLNPCFVYPIWSPSPPQSSIFYAFNSRIRICHYSTDKPAVIPVKIYMNADIEKIRILKENKGKAGVYR